MNKDTHIFEGTSVPRTIMKFAIPTVLSQLVTLIYNLADTFFVGHTNNPAQIAALALSFPLFMQLTMVGNLFGIGANSLISRSLGRGDRDTAHKSSAFALYGSIVLTIILAIILKIFMRPILTAIGAITPEAYAATSAYLTWTVIVGGIPTVAALMLAHMIRAEGDTKRASIGIALGGALNIVLDPIFVQGLRMGAGGAGLATAISNLFSCIYLIIIVCRNKESVIELNPAKIVLNGPIMKEVLLVGLPAAAIIILGATSNIVLTHFMAPYGDTPIAAYGVVQKIGTICMQVTIGLTQGIMPLLGFSYGSRNYDRVKSVMRYSILLLAIFDVICVAVFEIFSGGMIRLFTGDASTIEVGALFLRIWVLAIPGMTFTMLFNSSFQAMGKWFPSLMLSVIRQLLMYVPIVIIMNKFLGRNGLVCTQPIADTVALLVGVIMYMVMKNKMQTQDAKYAK